MKKTLIIAHRGFSQFAPENTLPALDMAIDLGCDGIEFDVQLTKDGIPVIIHDETINRTSNGTGFVKDYDLDELENFDFGMKFDPKYTGITIPTLEEFLLLASSKEFEGIINIELKNDQVYYADIEEKVLELIGHYNLFHQVIISSFNHKSISRIRKLSPEIKVSLLYDKKQTPSIKDLKNLKAYSANIDYTDASLELVKQLQKNDFQLLCYTVNSKKDINKIMNLGVDGIFTNNPALGLELKKSGFGL